MVLQNRNLRSLASASHFMVFASSTIVTGIISYFLNKFSFRNAHIIYQEVIVSCFCYLNHLDMLTRHS